MTFVWISCDGVKSQRVTVLNTSSRTSSMSTQTKKFFHDIAIVDDIRGSPDLSFAKDKSFPKKETDARKMTRKTMICFVVFLGLLPVIGIIVGVSSNYLDDVPSGSSSRLVVVIVVVVVVIVVVGLAARLSS